MNLPHCVLSIVYCFTNFVVVKPMGHGSYITGHGSIFAGSWLTAYDPLHAQLSGEGGGLSAT